MAPPRKRKASPIILAGKTLPAHVPFDAAGVLFKSGQRGQAWGSGLAPYLQNKRLNFGVAHTLGLEFVAVFAHLLDLSRKAVFAQLGLDGLHASFGDDYNIGSGPDWVVVHLKHMSVAAWIEDYTTNLTGYVVMQTTVVGPISHSPSTALFLL